MLYKYQIIRKVVWIRIPVPYFSAHTSYFFASNDCLCRTKTERGRGIGEAPLSPAIFHPSRPAESSFLSVCLPGEITGCFDGPLSLLLILIIDFHFRDRVNLIRRTRMLCFLYKRSMQAHARPKTFYSIISLSYSERKARNKITLARNEILT